MSQQKTAASMTWVGFRFMGQFAVNIGPEFFDHDGNRVVTNLRSPYAGGIHQGSIRGNISRTIRGAEHSAPGMITVGGDGRGERAADHFRIVELCAPGVGPGQENPAYGITRLVGKASGLRLIEARILMQDRGQNGAGKEVLNGAIGKGCHVTFSVGAPALPIGRFGIIRLIDSRQKCVPWILDVVETAACDDREFLFRRKGWKLSGILEAQKVGQRIKESVIGSSLGGGLACAAGLHRFARGLGGDLLNRGG